MEKIKRIPVLKIGVENHNNRIYCKHNLTKIVEHFNTEIKSGVKYGELNIDLLPFSNNDINIKNVSHIIEKIYIDNDVLYADIKILNTPNGKIALSMLHDGLLVLRTRTFSIVENKFVDVKLLSSIDLIRKENDTFKGIL